MAILVDVSTDSILGTDSVALSLAYQQVLLDALSASDQVFITRTLGVVPQDSVSASDTIAVGFVRWVSPTDSVSTTDTTGLAVSYHITNLDPVALTDVIHTWNPTTDQNFQASLEGGSELQAVLVKKVTTAPEVVAPPPRNVVLPKPPDPHIEYNTINLDPRRRF